MTLWAASSTKALANAEVSLKTVGDLLSLVKDGQGKPSTSERAIFAAAVVFLYGIWENYVEQLAIELVGHVSGAINADKVPEQVRRSLEKRSAWELTIHPGWKALWVQAVTLTAVGDDDERFGMNTAKAGQVKNLLVTAGASDPFSDISVGEIPSHLGSSAATIADAVNKLVNCAARSCTRAKCLMHCESTMCVNGATSSNSFAEALTPHRAINASACSRSNVAQQAVPADRPRLASLGSAGGWVSNHMKQFWRRLAPVALGFALLGLIAWGAVRLIAFLWHQLAGLNDNLAVGIVTAVTTILVATVTVVLGRYFERQREVESHYREKKTAIYDAFLIEYYKLFDNPGDKSGDLVKFLRDWRRQLVLWGGADVLMAFIRWKDHLAKGRPDAQAMFLTEELFKAIRSDLGLSNKGISKGAFIKLQLKSADLLLALAKKNPNVTLAELGAIEKTLGVTE